MTLPFSIFIIIILLVAACGGGLGWVVGQRHSVSEANRLRNEAQSAREQSLYLQGQLELLERENQHLHTRIDAQGETVQALAPIAQQLGTVDSYVRALESKTTQHFSSITAQLQNEAKISAQLSRTTESLDAILRNSSARGTWGEVQLHRIIEAAGMLERVDFDEQLATSQFSDSAQGRGRPDVTVHLPNGAHLAIDSKVPMSSYIAAHEISPHDYERASERQSLLLDHSKAVRKHVEALKKRNYPADFPQSPQLTVMFLPSEGLLAEALDADPQLLDYALSDGIILTSPASLLALLRSVAAIWRSAQASEQAREIVQAGNELVDRLSVFVKHLSKLGINLTNAVKSYNSAMSSLESRVLVTYRKFDALNEKISDLEAGSVLVDPDHSSTRALTAPELLETAEHAESDSGN
ncbi:DNA recombination protein RmuC [Arcanobacterium phocisimile]|uniref:DNA recombination protein RmuC n=1 Tax=Arcanobacterium phocisimile TaxID=1302235 RepID=A0ABX7IJC2_9ACTO|nr:DNA recombination protein RmuC [Arcanobacterium phocisimile]QRV01943.1 DNA recombination protein RmuC [Arcanobacterium phocisimile]